MIVLHHSQNNPKMVAEKRLICIRNTNFLLMVANHMTDDELQFVYDEMMEDVPHMKNAKLILANFDARLSKIEIQPKNNQTKVILSTRMYNEITDEKENAKIIFEMSRQLSFGLTILIV